MKDVNIKISVDTSNAESNLNTLDNGISKLGNTSKSTENKVEGLDKSIKKSKGGMDTLSNSANKTASAEKNMGNAAATASTKVKKLNNTTGQANNAVIELGRVASDAEYGLRGMGNNISQLATQIFQLMASQTQATAATKTNTVVTSTNAITTKSAANASKTASTAIAGQTAVTGVATTTTLGFVGAMKAIGSVMMGPLGFLFLIQGAIAGITAWANSSDDAVESTDGLADSFGTLADKLKDLGLSETQQAMRIEDYIKLSKIRAEIDNQKVKDDERLIETSERLTEIEAEKAAALELQIANEKQGNKKAALDNQETYNNLVKEGNKLKLEEVSIGFRAVESENKYAEAKDKVFLASSNTLDGLNREKAALVAVQKNVSTTSETYDEYADKIEEVQAKIDAIQGKKKGKGPRDTSDRDLAAIDAEIAAHLAKHKTLEENEVDAAERKYDKLLQNAEKYGYKVADIEAARLHTLYDIRDKFNLLELEQEQAKNDALLQLKLNQQNWEDSTIEDPMERLLAQGETIFLEEQQLQDKYLTEREMYQDDKEKLLELENQYNIDSQALIQERSDNSYNTIQLQKERELKAVKIAEDAKAKIINASANAAKSAFGLLKNLAGENKALQAAAIIGENAVGITKTIIESTAAGAKIKAVGLVAAQTSAVNPVSAAIVAATPFLLAANRLNAAASVATSVGAATQGLAALGESGNVSGGNVPDSGSGEIPAPTFNLVEGSEGNQIQNSIQNAGDTPLRAYVVADDVTSQQSLDRQIESNSGI
tara:strand:- start:194 stop:2512 length:2319 start_codon:yes stop_codon:yes gene_type:complete